MNFINGFHGNKFLGIFLLNQFASAEGPFSQHHLGVEIKDGDLFLEVLGKEGFGGFSDNLFFLLFPS